jgi:putative phage-type endonuclease
VTALFDAPTDAYRKAGPRVTPTAYLVLPATASRAEWLAARREGIGASDVPAILGVSDYGTPRSVYHDKTGEAVDGAGEAAHWGTVLEEPIAREWARRNRSVVRRVGLVARVDDPVMMCTLDRRITECPLPDTRREQCALEVKCRSAFKAARWHASLPDDVAGQMLWQLAVTGYDHLHYAVLVGGNDYRQGTVRRAEHEPTIRHITAACKRLWTEFVEPRIVPAADEEHGDRELEMYKRMHSARSGALTAPDPLAVTEALLAYEEHRLAEKRACKAKEAAQAEMLRLLGSYQAVLVDGQIAYSMESTRRAYADLERLAERWPDAYRDCVTDKPGRRLSVDPEFRKMAEAL